MATCVKTGIDVYINEYQATVRADLHDADGVRVVNFNPNSFKYNPDLNNQEYPYIWLEIGSGYFHKDKGIIVNPSVFFTRKGKENVD